MRQGCLLVPVAKAVEAVERIHAFKVELGHRLSLCCHCRILKLMGGPVPETFEGTLHQSRWNNVCQIKNTTHDG